MQKLQLFNEWKQEYLQRRYLQYDSAEQLYQRQADLTDNILGIGADGSGIIDEGEQFRRLLAHIHAEFELRNMRVPTGFRQKTYFHGERAAELWSKVQLLENTYLLKFGNSEYMIPMFEHGQIRVGNAKSFDDPSLNPAIRDCEVKFTEEWYGTTLEVPRGNLYAADGQNTCIETIGNVKRVAECSTDYYIACFVMKYDYRLFDDFSRGNKTSYDACLVIRQPQRFINRMRECGERELPGWDFYESPVAYRDPHHPIPYADSLDVFFTKHFRYAYQREFRMAWIPPMSDAKLESLEFVLGPLCDHCELLLL